MKDGLLFFILFLLSYLVPKKKKLLVFGGGDARQFQGNPKYLFLYLHHTQPDGFQYYWSAKSKQQQQQLLDLQLPFIDPYSLRGFFILLRAEYMFIEKSSYDTYFSSSIFGRFYFIQTWHGTPLKKIGMDAKASTNGAGIVYQNLKRIKFFSRQKYRLILASSQSVADILKRTFENENVVITGYPRNDIFSNPSLAVLKMGELLALDSYQKIILYAPTFRDHKASVSPFSSDLKEFNERLKDENYLFLVKKHPWQKNFTIADGLSHIIDVSAGVDDIQELLPRVDLLITDYSSTFFDFMLTGKPVIFYPYDFEEYLEKCRGLYYDYFKDLQGPFAKNELELTALIFSVETWKTDNSYLEKYQRVLNQANLYQEGHFSGRVLAQLYPEGNW